jgi:hypothetical protein
VMRALKTPERQAVVGLWEKTTATFGEDSSFSWQDSAPLTVARTITVPPLGPRLAGTARKEAT